MPSVGLEIPPRTAYVGVVRLVVSSLARAAGLDESSVDDLKIAVSEACANAVISNDEVGSTEPVSVEWLEDDDRVRVNISDNGPSLSDHTDDATGGRLRMSMALLGSLVDDFEFEVRDGGGMTATLIVRK